MQITSPPDAPPPYTPRATYDRVAPMRVSRVLAQPTYDTFDRAEPELRRLSFGRMTPRESQLLDDCGACCAVGTGVLVQLACFFGVAWLVAQCPCWGDC